LYGLLAIALIGGLYLIAARLLPAGEQIAPPVRDEPIWALPAERPLVAADVADVRLPVALRGYRFAETDLLLDRLVEELQSRDDEIARLRGPVPTAASGPRFDAYPGIKSDEPLDRDGPTPAQVQGDTTPQPAVESSAQSPAQSPKQSPPPSTPGALPAPPTSTAQSTAQSPPQITPGALPASRTSTALMTAEQGRSRCEWARSAPEYLAYHDEEWGRPLHGERALFERLSLEVFQSGLSWLIILRKRAAFRAAFADFDVDSVAKFDDADVARLVADGGIVRNRAKIEATIGNARAVRSAVPEGLDALLWSFAPEPRSGPPLLVPATSPESSAMAKELKRRGLKFVGPTTGYALMQAVGMVNDHAPNCWLAS